MASIKDLVSSLGPNETFFSYEFFPPKTKAVSEKYVAEPQRVNANAGSILRVFKT
jgi:hypothetical protein